MSVHKLLDAVTILAIALCILSFLTSLKISRDKSYDQKADTNFLKLYWFRKGTIGKVVDVAAVLSLLTAGIFLASYGYPWKESAFF
jgi:hypothetical protein